MSALLTPIELQPHMLAFNAAAAPEKTARILDAF
jgi:hypothetical protein